MTCNRSLEVNIHKHREGAADIHEHREGDAGSTALELVDNCTEKVVKRSQEVEEVEPQMRG
ncbi:hypothetical protein SADUNF_Sadunf16G0239100 [Salix dunnii]|uniref:Uncharacterized protein n=1 Tax=Salix dunnii TaxID=1413687 RepID=A0A835JG14_9ROSI|nr:hypothetical protein SADUNF_Sadunf16G0239100 [Salix dunnii]